jgi:hypothetical protein
MNPVLNSSEELEQAEEAAFPLNVVILYEDVDTGKSAKEMTDVLMEDLPSECELRCNLWRFDVLSMDPIKEWAAHEAAQAEMVVIAAHGDRPLPPQLEDWAETWLAQRSSRHGALVGLLVREPLHTSNAPWHYLRELAGRGNMDFFGHSLGERQGRSPEPNGAEVIEPTAGPASEPQFPGAGASEYRHWGINE